MLIRARMGISVDGFVATPEGLPALDLMPGFEPGVSHGHREFIEGCDAVVLGRSTFLPALGAPRWPWPGLQVHVLTSRPLPANTPSDVIIGRDGPAKLAEQLRSRGSGGDVHLVGGPRTIRAFQELGELDRLEILVLPVLLGPESRSARRGPRKRRWACSGRTGPSPMARSSWSMRRDDERAAGRLGEVTISTHRHQLRRWRPPGDDGIGALHRAMLIATRGSGPACRPEPATAAQRS